MAQVVDAARNVNTTTLNVATTPGGAFDRGFQINQSTADTHIDFVVTAGEEVGVNNTTDAAAPIINQSTFWLTKTANTDR